MKPSSLSSVVRLTIAIIVKGSRSSTKRLITLNIYRISNLEVAHDTYQVYIGMKKMFEIESYNEQSATYDHLLLEVEHRKWQGGMVLSATPVHKTEYGYTQVFDWSMNPLTKGIDICVVPMARKNQKRMDAAFQDLCGLAPRICDLWNQRDFDGIKALFS